jgi:hypothetical protein
VSAGHADHALRGALPAEHSLDEQPGDDLLARRADRGGLLAAQAGVRMWKAIFS